MTADGLVRRASRDENADLFWAVRGAGANFGVVTSFTFRLHEVGPTVVGGLVAWPFERADEILAAYRTLTEEAPRELAVWLLLLHAPPAPFVPAEWHGRKICAMAVCYSGDLDRTEEALAPIRGIGDPILDLLHEQPYVEVQSYLDATEPKGICHYWRTEFLAELGDGLLDAMRDLVDESDLPEAEIGVLHLGGALNERDGDDGAVGNRDARYAIGAKAMWAPTCRERRPVPGVGAERPTNACGRSRRGGPTSTSKATTRTRRAFGRRTARTTTGSSSSSGATTRGTCSARTGTSRRERPLRRA